MDLYEALKSGTSGGELTRTFIRELKDAQARVAADQEKEKKAADLERARENLVNALSDWSALCLDGELAEEFNDEVIRKYILDVEREMEYIKALTRRVKELSKKDSSEIDDRKLKELKMEADELRALIRRINRQ